MKFDVDHVSPELQVLIVEDNAICSAVLTGYLKRYGILAKGVATGGLGLHEVIRGSYDLVLLDIRLPEVSGLEIARKLREKERHKARHTFVVAVSASVLPKEQARAIEAGFDFFIAKPVCTEQLSEILEIATAYHAKDGVEKLLELIKAVFGKLPPTHLGCQHHSQNSQHPKPN